MKIDVFIEEGMAGARKAVILPVLRRCFQPVNPEASAALREAFFAADTG